MRKILILSMVGLLAACSAEERAGMEREKLESFNLSPAEYEVAAALVEGYKKETGRPLLRSQDYGRAACYARQVQMPAMYSRAHLMYLKNYPEIDRDFYGYFKRQGVGEQMAYQMSQKFKSAYDSCSNAALVKRLFEK